MSCIKGSKWVLGVALWSVPTSSRARSNASIAIAAPDEEEVKRRVLEHLRCQGVKPCPWRHAMSQSDYSGSKYEKKGGSPPPKPNTTHKQARPQPAKVKVEDRIEDYD